MLDFTPCRLTNRSARHEDLFARVGVIVFVIFGGLNN